MNRSLSGIAGVLLVGVVFTSILTHLQFEQDVQSRATNLSDTLTLNQSFDWQTVIDSHESFRREQAEEQQPVVQQEKELNILDSTLLAIVADEPSTITLLKEDSSQPIVLKRGEGWLKGWTLSDISADSVVWTNVESNETATQHLYGPSQREEENKLTAKIDGKR